VLEYPLPFVKEILTAFLKRKLREAEQFVYLIRLAVWGSEKDLKKVFKPEEADVEELLKELGDE